MPDSIAALQQPHIARRAHWVSQLNRHAHALPDHPALRFEGETITWAELLSRVRNLASAMVGRGVKRGDRVAINTGNRPELIETVLAANSLGAMAVPMNFRLTGSEAAYILRDSGAKLIVVDEFGLSVLPTLKENVPDLVVWVIGEGAGGDERYEDVLAKASTPPPEVDVAENTPALLMYTSGTTGRPKGAVLTHQNMQSQALTIVHAFRLGGEEEVSLVASPLFHIGAIGSVAPSLLIGGTLVIMPTRHFCASDLLELLEQERVTNVFLVPTQWEAVCSDPSLRQRDLSRLRITAWGAAPATDVQLQQMAEAFPNAENIALFGQTEMSPVTCVLAGSKATQKLGSVGKPVPSVSIRIVDANMNDVPPGEIGEIVYRGSGLMQGYWNNPEATAEAFRGGWFHSGDLVRSDNDGYIYVVDRVKDMIISGGENIYSAEVENVLASHPLIADVSVVGAQHDVWGETPVAYVVLSSESDDLNLSELREWAGEYLARYKLPTELRVVQKLPRNASGKVLKGVLRDNRVAY